jgi:hypothetical protein
MKTSFMLFVLVSGVLSGSVHAATKTEDLPAIVVSVETHQPQSNTNYAGSFDLPLQPETYSYHIAIRVGSIIYRTDYDSAFDGLPAVFATNHPIQVSLGNHVMCVTLPGDGPVRMAIESRDEAPGRIPPMTRN